MIKKLIVFLFVICAISCTKKLSNFNTIQGLQFTQEELCLKVIEAFFKTHFNDCNDTCRFKINSVVQFDNRSFHYCKNYKKEFYKNHYSLENSFIIQNGLDLKINKIGEILINNFHQNADFSFTPVVYFPEQHFFYAECNDIKKNKFYRLGGMVLGDRLFLDTVCDVHECMELPNDMQGDLNNVKSVLEDDQN